MCIDQFNRKFASFDVSIYVFREWIISCTLPKKNKHKPE